MFNFKQTRRISISLFTVISVLALVLPRPNYSQSRPAPRSVEQTQGAASTRASEQGQKHSPDPCDEEFPPGNAYGLRKKCVGGGSGGVSRGDFNGDGFADLAVGVPFEDGGGFTNSGAIHIIYGSATGLSATAGPGTQFFLASFNPFGSPDGMEIGSSLAAGDFNGDGFSDLALGAPFAEVNGVSNAGFVEVLYGSPSGLASASSPPFQAFAQGIGGIADTPETFDQFGTSLNWGDFNGDGFGDLVVGVPRESVGGVDRAGAVHVIYGSPAGLSATAGPGNQFWTQDTGTILDKVEVDDRFGRALTAGDFNNDGRDDLAIGAPLEGVAVFNGSTFTTENIAAAGGVNVIYGTVNGLSDANNQFWSQASLGILDDAERDDTFGDALAAGDFNGDGFADLVVGVPFEDVGSVQNAGAVNVIYGSANRLSASAGPGNQFWTQDSPVILDVAEENDEFGFALAAGDFNGDGRADLAIGVPFEGVGSAVLAGAVNVIYGSGNGLRAFFTISSPSGVTIVSTNQFWTENNTNFLTAEPRDTFGSSLTAWNFGNDSQNGSQADLAVGIPLKDVSNAQGIIISNAGAVGVLYGTPPQSSTNIGGLSNVNFQFWTQESPGIPDDAEFNDQFGATIY